ncbi:hypothetical protein HMPREF0731_4749 [Pseudoroseomonas cervicalis ATCC 49957]|uniref:Uncharacterized protein n=1 Tax=Pseudoroseomonas cervicalis ATCC 49957 TaxID=525371 RepID=D5RUI7_9PROT|nr:hypothetical protein HMPREF0731_4749 [Pseudoroseomonas cervicalis ATCC 49957]
MGAPGGRAPFRAATRPKPVRGGVGAVFCAAGSGASARRWGGGADAEGGVAAIGSAASSGDQARARR